MHFTLFPLLLLCLILQANAVVLGQPPVYTNQWGMEFVLIKPGTMLVGKFQPTVGKPEPGSAISDSIYHLALQMAKKDATPGFQTHLTKAYYIGKFEITQDQWRKVMGNNPSFFQSDTSGNYPVTNISWKEARVFVKKLNRLDKSGNTYRLPTEFEWEYAARAGADDDISWTDIRAMAVLSGITPSKIGLKQPNAWDLYDMLGNVWEWVEDYYNEKIFADPVPPRKGKEHVLKGASFTGDVKNATYMTHAAGPGNGFDVGVRVVMEVK